MNLELSYNRQNLIFEKEYNLNTKPLEIDLLIIKKESDIPIKNGIGHLFKGHNIIEYKSPDDITVSIVRDSKPRELLKFLDTHGFSLSMPYKGIYYVNENVLFSTQIIVTRELEKENHTWLRVLSENVKPFDAQRLLSNLHNLKEKFDRDMADSVLKVMIDANKQILEDWKGDDSMFDYLMEIVEPQIRIREENERKKGIHQGIQQGIRMTIDSLRDFGHDDSDIKSVIMRRYQLSSEEANEFFKIGRASCRESV